MAASRTDGATASAEEATKLERRNRELSILNGIAQALNRSVALDDALRATLAQVAELLGLHTGWIWLLDEENSESYLGAAQNLPPALSNNPERMAGQCYCLDTYRAGDLNGAANVNVVACSRLKGLVDGADGLRYHASIPLYAHGKKLGVMNVASADWRELGADDLRLLYTIGDLVGIAIERARLFARSAQLGAVEERNRLARELHDTLAQGLASIALQLELADALLENDPAERRRIQEVVRTALRLAQANLEETRRSVQDLRAAPLEGRTLAEALKALAQNFSSSVGPRITVKLIGESPPLATRLENGLYRLAQEALTNAVRHANARHITILLDITAKRIRLKVTDDGQGFDPENASPEHYGLVGMNERVKLLGGALTLKSCPGKGATVDMRIPMTKGQR